MKKRTVQIILILLTGSMLAIVIAQLLWVSDAFRLKDANFRNQVDAALKEVNILLEDRFTSIYTFNKIQLQPGESIILVQSNADITLCNPVQFREKLFLKVVLFFIIGHLSNLNQKIFADWL